MDVTKFLLNAEGMSVGVCVAAALPLMVFRVKQNGPYVYVISVIFFLLIALAIITPVAAFLLDDSFPVAFGMVFSFILFLCVEGIERRQKFGNPSFIAFLFPLMIWFAMFSLLAVLAALRGIVHALL